MYSEITSFSMDNGMNYRRVIAKGPKGFFVCSFCYRTGKYIRPCQEGGRVESLNLDYLAIGAKFYDNEGDAKKELTRRYSS